MTSLNKEFALQKEQMRNTSSESQKLEASMTKLNSQYELAKGKTQVTADALAKVKQVTGENSEETRIWTNKLLTAEKQEQSLKNQIDGTNKKLIEAKKAESDAAQASQKRQQTLKSLSAEQKKLETSSSNLSKEYQLEVAQLGNNAKASDKARLAKQYYAKQEQATALQVKNLEKQLALAKQEYGENSQKVQELSGKLLEAKKANQEFANSFAESNNKLKAFGTVATNAGNKLKGIGKGMTVGVTAPIVAGVAASVKAASDFDNAFTGVKKTVDEQRNSNGKVTISYNDLEKSIRNMAKTIPATTTEISHVAEAAGQLGIKTPNVMGFTRTMIDMGQATNMSSEDAGVALAKLANITGMPQKNFDRLGSSIVNLGNNMATTESDIVDMSLRLAGTGHQVGLTESQITGMAAAMSSVGIQAEAGGGAMSRVMQKINTAVAGGGKDLDSFAKASGMSSSEFKKHWKDDASGAIVSFVKGLGKAKTSGKDVTSMLKDMGINSTQEIDTMLRLSGAGGTLAKALKVSGDGWKSNTALTNEAEKRYSTFSSKLKVVKNKVKDLGIEFGGPLMDALSNVLDAMQPVFKVLENIAKAFSNASPETQKFVVAIAAIAAAVGPVLVVIGSLLSALGSIATALGLAATWPVVLVAAIIAIVTVLVTFIVTHWDQIKAKTEEVWNAISTTLTNVWTSIVSGASSIFSSLGAFFSGIWTAISTTVSSVWTGIVSFLTNLWTGITTTASSIWGGLTGIFTMIFLTIQSVIQGVWLFITSWLQFTWQSIVALTQPIWQPIASFFSSLWQGISSVAQSVWNSVSSFLSGIWTGISNVAKTVFNALKAFFSTIWNAIKSVTTSVWNAIKSVITSAWNGIKSVVTSALNAVKSAVSSGWNAVKSATSSVLNAVKSVVTSIWNGIKSTISSVVDGVKSKVTSGWNAVKSVTSSVWNGIKSAMITPVNAAKNKISGIVDAIKRFFSGMHLRIPRISLPPMPHFHLSGEFSLKNKTVPHLSVSWNAIGGIMTSPMIFGSAGGQLQGGGEAGHEAILPLNYKNLSVIGNQIAQATDEKANQSVTQNIQMTFNNTVRDNGDVNRIFEKADQWIGQTGIKNSFGVRGNA